MKKEMTQKEMNATIIATLEGIMSVCEKTTSGNVSHNIATIRCKCRDMLQFFDEWNKHIPSATEDVLSRVPELQWGKIYTDLVAYTDLFSYRIEKLPSGEVNLTTLYVDELDEVWVNVEEAKKRANEHHKESIKKLLGI